MDKFMIEHEHFMGPSDEKWALNRRPKIIFIATHSVGTEWESSDILIYCIFIHYGIGQNVVAH